jgi:hypothetical protein
MGTWPEYLHNSLGLRIFLGVCLLLLISVMVSQSVEKKRLQGGSPEGDRQTESIETLKRLWIGMLAGFIVAVVIGVTQFIVRFGYFTLLQEIGAMVFGMVGAVVGGVCGILNRRRKTG